MLKTQYEKSKMKTNITDLAFFFSTEEYTSLVWEQAQAKNMDKVLNEKYQLNIGCLNNALENKLYNLFGFILPKIERSVHADWKWTKMMKECMKCMEHKHLQIDLNLETVLWREQNR